MMLGACSTTKVEYVPKPVPVPSSLIAHPSCSPSEVGYSVDSLVRAYVNTKNCNNEYQNILNSIKVFNEALDGED